MKTPLLLALIMIGAAAQDVPFRFDASPDKLQSGHWRVAGLPRTYVEELLPALFERTLEIDRFDTREGALDWIFTGESGGFTIHVDRTNLRVSQRYYDSFALADASHSARHPERTTVESTAPYRGGLRSIAVRLDAKLALIVSINGKEAIRQNCLLDVRRHQLAWTGTEGIAEGRLAAPAPAATATVDVNPSQPHQTMLGFGGITTPTAYAQLGEEGKRRWWTLLAEYNLLLQREYPIGARLNPQMDNWDRMADATPHYYGDNFPNGEITSFAYLKTLRSLSGKVVFEFWALPPWAQKNGDPDAELYARAMVRYCQIARERAGAPPDIVGIQNEVAQRPEVWQRMTLALRSALDQAGFQAVKIHTRDDGRLAGGIECARAFRQSPAVWKAIDYAAAHLYDYQKYLFDPDGFDALMTEWHKLTAGKPFLSTELCLNDSRFQERSYRLALAMGQLYHKNLTLADASALFYCWLLLNVEQPSYGWTRTLFVPDAAHGFMPVESSYQARVFGAYSRRVKAGMVRVEARASDPDLLVTAFSGSNGARTLVVLNRSVEPRRIKLNWTGRPFRFVETTGPYAANTAAPAPRELVVEPGAIATLSTQDLGKLPPGF